MQTFSIQDIIKRSWQAFLNHWGVLWGVLLVMGASNLLIDQLLKAGEDTVVASAVSLIMALYITAVMQLGLVRVTLNIARGTSATVGQLCSEYTLATRYLGASILYGLIVLVGCVLLIVPGIIWAIKYAYYPYAIVDRRLGIMDSLKYSATLTNGVKGRLFLFGIVFGLLMVASMLPLGLGLLATVPMAIVSSAIIYITLTSAAGNNQDIHSEATTSDQQPTPGQGNSGPQQSDTVPQQSQDAPQPFVPLGP